MPSGVPLKDLLSQLTSSNGKWSPYDPVLGNVLGDAQRQLSSSASAYTSGLKRTQTDYDDQLRDLKDLNTKTLRSSTDNFASNGILRSGIFQKAQGDIGQAYQKDVNTTTDRRQRDISALTSQRLGQENNIRSLVMNASTQSAERLRAQKQAEAQSAADAAHQQQLLELQRQMIEAQKAQANAFRGGLGPTGQVMPGGQKSEAEQVQDFWQLLAFFNELERQKQQKESAKNPFTNRDPHYL